MRSAVSGTSRSRPSRLLDGVVLLTGFLVLGGVLFSSKRKGDGNDDEQPETPGPERPDQLTRAEDGQGALEAAEYRTLIEGLPLVTYINRLDGATVFISPQVEQLLGFPADRWLAEPEFVNALLHPEDRSRVEAEAERARTSNQHFL
jgi:PAS domain-containing protein